MKINFVYHRLKMLGSGWMGSEGLRRALERNNIVDYVYDQMDEVMGNISVNIDKLRMNPIFFVRGFLNGRMPIVARAGGQFKACWNSESLYTRHGTPDTSTPKVLENQQHFNMMFTCAETDLNAYKIPTYLLPSWCDTHIFKDVCPVEYTDRIAYIGGRKDREDFLSQDKEGIIHQFQTEHRPNDPFEQTRDYVKAICKYSMLVSPPGRMFTGMTGRAFEIMGCKRMAFVYLNPDTMFEHMKFFKDGVDLAYFSSFKELSEKFKYYVKKPEKVAEIANNGYLKVSQMHNADVRVKYIHDCMEIEYQKWLQDQENIPEEINQIYNAML